MTSGVPPSSEQVVRVELDLGLYELGEDECRELIRRLRERGRQRGDEPAAACADRLEALLFGTAGIRPAGRATERELDALAEAAWEWCGEVGSGALPERVLRILDVLRARRARD